MKKIAVKIAVWEYEKGWGSKVDDYMVCKTIEDAKAFKKEFNGKNTEESTPDWYMQVEGDPIPFDITEEQFKVLEEKDRVWLGTLKQI